MDVKTLAQQARNWFEYKKRDSGAEFWCTSSDLPRWVQDLCLAAHNDGNISPDDVRYEYIVSALDAIANYGDSEDAQQAATEADIYTSDLLEWLSSRVDRFAYVDEAIEEYGEFGSIIGAITAGQVKEREEVYFSVLKSLHDRLEEISH
jgi:hypothetical protein